jgi:acyl-CoA thioester hydrolase
VEKMGRNSYVHDLEEWKSSFDDVYYETCVRFSETDMFGHLNNTVPFIYFEAARIHFFQRLGVMADWTNPLYEAMPVAADLQCDFMKQIFFDEKLEVYVKAHKIGNSSVDLHYMVKNEHGELCLTGRGTMVQISKKRAKRFRGQKR